MSDMMTEVAGLRKLALEQGWQVDRSSKGHWRFIPPAGEIVMVQADPSPRMFANSKSRLKRNGLVVDAPRKERTTVREDSSPVVEPDQVAAKPVTQSRADVMEAALLTATEMIDVLGEEVADLRTSLGEARQVITMLQRRVDALEGAKFDRSDLVTAQDLLDVERAWQERLALGLADVGRKADPIGVFRARLRGTEPASLGVDHVCQHCGKRFDSGNALGGHAAKVHGRAR